MPSVDHVVHHVLAPMAIEALDCIVPVIRHLVIILHESPSACYILSDESSIPFYSTSTGYKNSKVKPNRWLQRDCQLKKIKLLFKINQKRL